MEPLLSRRLDALLARASLELSPRDPDAGDGLRDLFAPGRAVFVNHPAGVTHHEILAACKRLARAGFVPVPHVAARRLFSFTQASDFVARAAGEAGARSVLVVAGDLDPAAGPFADSRELLASGLFERRGIGHVVFAGYPGGHPRISSRALDLALVEKLALARERGLDASLVTQFGFEPAAIRRWLASLPARNIRCPVSVGVAGPASLATLAKFALRSGAGAMLCALARRQAAFARGLSEVTPDRLIEALFGEELRGARVAGLHIFAFGGVRRAAEWLHGRREAA